MWALPDTSSTMHRVPQHNEPMPNCAPALCGTTPNVVWAYVPLRDQRKYERCQACQQIVTQYARLG